MASVDLLTTSGIDSLINSYKDNEISSRIKPLTTRRTKYQNISSKYGVLSSRLDSLKTVLSSMTSTTSTFYSTRASSSSNTSFISVSNTSTAALGSYSLRVSQLAKNDLLASSTLTSDNASGIAAGTYKINVKVGELDKNVDVTIGENATSKDVMQAIRDAMNADDDVKKVVSSAVFSPTSSTSKLSFSSITSGADNKIVLSDVDSGSLLSSVGITSELVSSRTQMTGDSAGYEYSSTDSLNASFKLNGIQITRNSNTISDVIDGLTFNLNSVMQESDASVKIEVSNSTSNFKSKIQEFVTKFNDVFNYIRNNSSSSSTGIRGDLIGDPTAIAVSRALSSAATSSFTGLSDSTLSKLSDAGLNYSSISGITIDSTKLDDALANKLDSLKEIFNSENGFAKKLSSTIEPALGAAGYIAKAQSSISSNISSITTKITSTNERIDKSAEVLRKQYQQMQLDLANLVNMQNTFYSYYSNSGTASY